MDRNTLDIVVGVCTKNCADTVAGVIKTVDRGLTQFFPSKRILIVVSDGFSTDATQEKVQETETTTEVMFTPQTGGLGKGNGVRTILEIARERGASAVALVDGDLTSIESNWVTIRSAAAQPRASGTGWEASTISTLQVVTLYPSAVTTSPQAICSFKRSSKVAAIRAEAFPMPTTIIR